MKKYLFVLKNTWDETLTYRINFIMWRVRMIVFLISLYFLWLAVMPSEGTLFGYTKQFMITYILGTSLLSAIIQSTRSHVIADEINFGTLSHFLIRPINYFYYWFARDLGDKAINIVFSIFELTILFLLLRPPFFIQTDISYIFPFIISILLAVVLYFLFSLLLSFIGFWSAEVWAPRFIFFAVSSFLAGGYFPLDILPTPLFEFFTFLPFGYILYFPLKVYLGQLPLLQIYTGLAISTFWVFSLYIFAKYVWTRGLRIYTAQGN